MVGAASVQWIHRGRDGGQLLRLDAPAAGELILMRPALPSGIVVAKVDASGVHDLRVDLAAALGGVADPDGDWGLGFRSGEDLAAAVGGDATERGLRTTRALIDGRPYKLRLVASLDEPCELRVASRDPWAEIVRATVEDDQLVVTCELPVGLEPPSEAVWTPRGSDGPDAPVRVSPVTAADGAFTFATDLVRFPLLADVNHWDASLRCGTRSVRVGRHLDDVIDRRRAAIFAQARTNGETSRFVTPYFNRFNNLAILVEPETAASGDSHADAAAHDQPTDEMDVPGLLGRAVAWIAARLLRLAEQDVPAGPSPLRRGEPGPVHLVLAHAYGVGGTVRTTTNLASALAKQHDVELLSVYRLHQERYFDVAPEVHRRTLVDHPWLQSQPRWDPRTWLRRWALRQPSVLLPPRDRLGHHFSLLSDVQLVRWLRSVRSGTIVATRPGLNAIIARFARPGVLLVGQQHSAVAAQNEQLWAQVRGSYRRLHGMTALTIADTEALRDHLAGTATKVATLPNSLTYADPPRSPLTDRVVIAAGQYSRAKGVDALLEAFAAATEDHPEWELRVYGRAQRGEVLAARAHARKLGIADRVLLMPPTPRLEVEMSKASVGVSASRFEAFGMTILEAMSCGLPVVAFDCPHGPRELITDGVDGRLVTLNDVPGLGAVLRQLLEDDAERRRLGAAAQRSASRFLPERVAPRFTAFLEELQREFAGRGTADASRRA